MASASSDVIVVGAGLAGASAASALTARGLKVTVIEARDRTGGRGFARGFAGSEESLEFGGGWITPSHARIREHCRRHGVALRPRAAVTERRWYRDGALHRDGPTSPEDRNRHERVIARIAADAILLKSGHDKDEKGRPIAGVSFIDYLDRLDPPPATRDLLSAWWTVSGNAEKSVAPASELLGSSAYGEGLTDAMIDVWVETLVGGVSGLSARMIAASGATLLQSRPVASIRCQADGIVATLADGTSLEARAAVIATGLNPMRNIRFDPGLSAGKTEAIAKGHIGRAVKIWVKATGVPVGILATGGGSGSGIEWLFAERPSADGATLLVGFGVAADGWTPAMPRDAEIAMARFFPEAQILAVDWHDWIADPHSLGTWVSAIAGSEALFEHENWRAEGRLAFASSDFAPAHAGWFEGAVTSGEAAADEIARALGKNQ
ncbi:monoamine oxidase [Hypericibacter terrae]|uniref:Monoamine oxidase n=1 Tax=Hypericibacter terrae TaxID=2602015 RepID=A0A5J6MQW2_9PROT|nr:NAD(P)/FAD-dependent oxidoreductase [Hypericibacter terrae]QEX19804.1 monoamine oxidase [Hypericibacter terrae]